MLYAVHVRQLISNLMILKLFEIAQGLAVC